MTSQSPTTIFLGHYDFIADCVELSVGKGISFSPIWVIIWFLLSDCLILFVSSSYRDKSKKIDSHLSALNRIVSTFMFTVLLNS